MGINLQQLVDNAFSEQMGALQQEVAAGVEEINALRQDIDSAQEVISAYQDENEYLKARVAELEAAQPEPEPEEPEEPTGPEEPAPEPGGFRWPDASNTGVPAGTVLTDYTGPDVITTAGAVIDGKIIRKKLTIMAPDVVIRRSKLLGRAHENGWSGDWGINGDDNRATNLTIEDCELAGWVKAILGRGTFQRLNIHTTVIAITLKDGKSTVRANHIHDLKGPADSHFDGVFIAGGQKDCLVVDNRIEIPSEGGTASIFIATRWKDSHITDTIVRHNLLLGTPSYAMYAEQTSLARISGTQFIDNEVQRGAYGHFNISGTSVLRSGNVDAFTGAPIE